MVDNAEICEWLVKDEGTVVLLYLLPFILENKILPLEL